MYKFDLDMDYDESDDQDFQCTTDDCRIQGLWDDVNDYLENLNH